MKRSFWNTLTTWKESPQRKPLLVQGARQVGKTWILKRFGEVQFENCILLDFAENKELNGFFTPNLKPERIFAFIPFITSLIHIALFHVFLCQPV